ncbi:pumilio-family RNA protein [Gregarina niphandrodes]|uniref:Pumilio-family RNA protein n=1 Tax=Gregarina niphandrodes TaxID=110365 RepID=A0A023B193_GRENI|nr:pumilio-family RNA protein [Gregarina niphandrodes]EZG46183.1 pumilio-family RNA protein [Gregarina niphandrodes]|eukprot:XP_011132344.1 pumilio-family RNA protein [Gregarina niphandrodes]
MTRPEKRIPEYSHHLQKLSVSLPQDFVRLDGDKFTKKLQASIKSDVKKGVLKDPFEYELDLMREWYDRCRMSVCAGRFEPGPMRLSSYRDLLAAALQVRLSDLPADKGKKRPARREPAQGAGRAAAQGGGRTAPGAGRAAGFLTAIWNDQYTDNEIFNDIFPLRASAVPPPPPPPPPPRVQQQETIASSFNDILPNIVALAEDQMGVKYLQSVLSMCSEAEYNVSLNALGSDLYRLSFHVYGNHVVQKLLEVGSTLDRRGSNGEYCRRIFGLCMAGHCVDLSLDSYGCRVLQRGLDYLYLRDKLEMLKELISRRGCRGSDGHTFGGRGGKGSTLLRLIEDQNGNHVVQKMVDRLPANDCAIIVDELLGGGDVVAISLHSYGCRVMQRVLEHCPHSVTYKMLNKLQPGIEILIRDQFGNYVVQHILKYGRLSDKQIVVNLVVNNITYYSCHKYASNVVERCLEKYVPQQMRASIVLATFTPTPPVGTTSLPSRTPSGAPGGPVTGAPCYRPAGKTGMKTTNFNNEFNRASQSPEAQLPETQSPEAQTRSSIDVSPTDMSPADVPPAHASPTDLHFAGKSSIQKASAGEVLAGVATELKVKIEGEPATGAVDAAGSKQTVSKSAGVNVTHVTESRAKSEDQSFFSGVGKSRNGEISNDHGSNQRGCNGHGSNQRGCNDHGSNQRGCNDRDLGKPPILSMIRDPYANYVVQKILVSYDVLDLSDPGRREVFNKLQKHVPALKKFTYGKHIVEGIERLKKQIAEMPPPAIDPGLTVVSQ